MADEAEEIVSTKHARGLGAKFTVNGTEREIAGFILKDGGVLWEFRKEGRVYPLSLSREGMDVMIYLWHRLVWEGPGFDDGDADAAVGTSQESK